MTTKIHLACDGKGRPLAILLTPGQRHDSVCASPLLERIRVPRTGLGRPRCKPDQVIADKAYSSRGFRAYLRKHGIGCTIPEKADQQQHRHNRGRRGGRPPAFDRQFYRRRNRSAPPGGRLHDVRPSGSRSPLSACPRATHPFGVTAPGVKQP
ncbi:transposase [Streptomyces sp. NPDC001414]